MIAWLLSLFTRPLPEPARGTVVTNWGLRAGKPWRIL